MKNQYITIVLFFYFSIVQICFCNDIYFINSDETVYVDDNVICKGNVIVMYEGRIISADEITYNQKKEEVLAKGKVILKDEQQNVYFFSSLRVSRNFDNGEGDDIKIIMNDRSRLAAKKCYLKQGKFELRNAIYTPCYECVAFDELTWQAKASHVNLDLDDTIDYEDLTVELLGNTAFYLPYLSVPSPKIKKRTGFLAPKFSVSSKGGFSVLPQYFIDISGNQELILKPIITQKIGSVAWLYYGSRFKNGEFSIDASITGVKSAKEARSDITDVKERNNVDKIIKSGYRGHIFSTFKYEINDIWRFSSFINLASDRYYMQRFPFLYNNDRILESKAMLEGFDNRDYSLAKVSMFQARNDDETPKAFPILEKTFSRELFEGTLDVNTMFLNLLFKNGRKANKLASIISWSKECVFLNGHLLEFKIMALLKALKVSEKTKTAYDSFVDATPQVSLIWKWPLLFSCDGFETVFTPIVGIIAAGNRNRTDIFEEQFTEINDINFLSTEKTISPYNIDYGSRVCYGTKISVYNGSQNLAYFTLGRTTEITNRKEESDSTGLKHKNSNIVTYGEVFLANDISLIFNGSYSSHKKEWTKSEWGIRGAYQKLFFDILFFNGKQATYNPFLSYADKDDHDEKYKGAMLDLGYQVNSKLTLKGGLIFGTESHKNNRNVTYRLIKQSVGVEYKNECANIKIGVERTRYRRGDIKPQTNFSFVITLKNFGS